MNKLLEIEKQMSQLRYEISQIEQQLKVKKSVLMSLKNQKDVIQAPDLFEQMFGESVTVPSIYTDTPLAEEYYGG